MTRQQMFLCSKVSVVPHKFWEIEWAITRKSRIRYFNIFINYLTKIVKGTHIKFENDKYELFCILENRNKFHNHVHKDWAKINRMKTLDCNVHWNQCDIAAKYKCNFMLHQQKCNFQFIEGNTSNVLCIDQTPLWVFCPVVTCFNKNSRN